MPTDQPSPHSWPPFYFERDGTRFLPAGLARSPWDRDAIAGGPVSALLATACQDPALDDSMEIARFSVDILGKVPHRPLSVSSEVLRDGRQTKLHRLTLLADDRPAAQVQVLRVRRMETPVFAVPHAYGSPHDHPIVTPKFGAFNMAGAVEFRPVTGGPGEPGPGTAWLSMNGEVVKGERPSNFVKACLFADFGNGFGAATNAADWSYANLDITVQFLRMPVGDWFLLDADTHMAGNGHGTARNIFADELGVFGRGFQTIFVAPGHQSKSLPKRRT